MLLAVGIVCAGLPFAPRAAPLDHSVLISLDICNPVQAFNAVSGGCALPLLLAPTRALSPTPAYRIARDPVLCPVSLDLEPPDPPPPKRRTV